MFHSDEICQQTRNNAKEDKYFSYVSAGQTKRIYYVLRSHKRFVVNQNISNNDRDGEKNLLINNPNIILTNRF